MAGELAALDVNDKDSRIKINNRMKILSDQLTRYNNDIMAIEDNDGMGKKIREVQGLVQRELNGKTNDQVQKRIETIKAREAELQEQLQKSLKGMSKVNVKLEHAKLYVEGRKLGDMVETLVRNGGLQRNEVRETVYDMAIAFGEMMQGSEEAGDRYGTLVRKLAENMVDNGTSTTGLEDLQAQLDEEDILIPYTLNRKEAAGLKEHGISVRDYARAVGHSVKVVDSTKSFAEDYWFTSSTGERVTSDTSTPYSRVFGYLNENDIYDAPYLIYQKFMEARRADDNKTYPYGAQAVQNGTGPATREEAVLQAMMDVGEMSATNGINSPDLTNLGDLDTTAKLVAAIYDKAAKTERNRKAMEQKLRDSQEFVDAVTEVGLQDMTNNGGLVEYLLDYADRMSYGFAKIAANDQREIDQDRSREKAEARRADTAEAALARYEQEMQDRIAKLNEQRKLMESKAALKYEELQERIRQNESNRNMREKNARLVNNIRRIVANVDKKLRMEKDIGTQKVPEHMKKLVLETMQTMADHGSWLAFDAVGTNGANKISHLQAQYA